MIYATGDCHGACRRFSTKCFPEQKQMTKADMVLILGDFGGNLPSVLHLMRCIL